jgi:hypothetical protein
MHQTLTSYFSHSGCFRVLLGRAGPGRVGGALRALYLGVGRPSPCSLDDVRRGEITEPEALSSPPLGFYGG